MTIVEYIRTVVIQAMEEITNIVILIEGMLLAWIDLEIGG